FVFKAEDGIRDWSVTGVQTCALPIFRNRAAVLETMAAVRPDAIVHTAAQPSHDRAASIPFEDFETNAVGTLNVLEAVRKYCPERSEERRVGKGRRGPAGAERESERRE